MYSASNCNQPSPQLPGVSAASTGGGEQDTDPTANRRPVKNTLNTVPGVAFTGSTSNVPTIASLVTLPDWWTLQSIDTTELRLIGVSQANQARETKRSLLYSSRKAPGKLLHGRRVF
jgi:hypothetical protein